MSREPKQPVDDPAAGDAAEPTAPTWSTGGGGFTVEDEVATSYLAALLSAATPFGHELGAPIRVAWQVGESGWRLDDLLVETGSEARCAISIKSNVQVTAGGAPQDFVRRCWEQLLEPGPFDEGRDLLALVQAPGGAGVRADIHELLRAARSRSDGNTARRIATTRRKKVLLASFGCPDDLAAKVDAKTDVSSERLLRRLLILDADVRSVPSRHRDEALGYCAAALDGASAGTPRELWNELLAISARSRPLGGSADWETLRGELAERFRLTLAPDFVASWRALDRRTTESLDAQVDALGHRVRLARAADADRLKHAIREHPLTAVVGPSGCGKSALAKSWAQDPTGHGVWITAGDLTAGLAGLRRRLALRYELLDVLGRSPDTLRIIIDGLDRVFADNHREAFAAAAHIARSVAEGAAGPDARLVITCQQAEWGRVARTFADVGLAPSFHQLAVGDFDEQDLVEAFAALPQLAEFAARTGIRGVLRRPKVLDLLVSGLASGVDPGALADSSDESDVAQWFWQQLAIGTGADRTRRELALRAIAERQGDLLEPATQVADLADAAALGVALDGLVRDGVCERERMSVAFAHDLYGDWSRLAILEAHSANLAAYLRGRLTSPLWHRAVRLYAQTQLDGPAGPERWARVLGETTGDSPDVLEDLFLDAAFYHHNADGALTGLLPRLIDDRGRLLGRLLLRFLHEATFPDPRHLKIIREIAPALETHTASANRLPIYPLWPAVLRLLAGNAADLVELAPVPVAQVADHWLRGTPPDWPLRDRAATIALAVADWTLKLVEDRVGLPEEVEVPLYRSVLAAGSERPEEATQFALAVIGVPPPPSVPVRLEQSINTRARPSDRPNFRTLCLEADALRPLWTTRPDLAAQIIEHCAIEPPPHPLELEMSIGHEDLGITDAPHWMTSVPERGCFLTFLRDAPDEAVGLVVRLANHAAERWVERGRREGDPTPPLDIEFDDGRTTRWIGDPSVLGWHRGNGHVPSVLTCALMALEQWLYERHDAGDDLTPVLAQLQDETRSVAIIGVLCSLGCREPELLTGALRPLLAVAELYSWAHQTMLQTPPSLMLPAFNEPAEMLERARAWHALSHRRREFEWVALSMMFGNADLEAFMASARKRWLQRANNSEDRQRDMLRHLAPRFDRANYRATQINGQDVWVYELPADLRADADAAAAEMQRALFWTSRPYKLREYIDGEAVGSDDDAEELWTDTTRHLLEPAIEEFEREGVRRRVDVECALAAALIVKHNSWLASNPERAQWCRGILREALDNPAPRPWFDQDTDPSEDRWDCFCADAVAALWADAPDDLELRRWVLQLATDRHYAVVARMFARCADRRDRLGPWFGRLEHFALRWALARAITLAHRQRPGSKPTDPPATTQAAIQAFADGTLEPDLPRWAADALEAPTDDTEAQPPRRRRGRRRPQPASGMDMNYVAAAFRWLPALGEARDEHERTRWLTFWRQILDVLQRRLEADDLVDDHSGPMMRWEHWALHRLGGEILELRSNDNPRGPSRVRRRPGYLAFKSQEMRLKEEERSTVPVIA